MAESTSPALAQDTACSALRPPNTTATRILRCPCTHPPKVRHGKARDPAGTRENWRGPRTSRELARLRPTERLQGHIRIRNEIFRVLQADGEAYRSGVDAPGGQRPVVQLAMRGRGHVAHLGVRPAQRGRELGQPQLV